MWEDAFDYFFFLYKIKYYIWVIMTIKTYTRILQVTLFNQSTLICKALNHSNEHLKVFLFLFFYKRGPPEQAKCDSDPEKLPCGKRPGADPL